MPIVTDLGWAAVSNKPMEVDWGHFSSNCYAWAADCANPTSAKPDPGKKSNFVVKQQGRFDASLLKLGAVADGMILAGGTQTDPPSERDNHYLVALYLSKNGGDHHWYRKDPVTGRWTHKPGAHGVRNFGVGMKVLPSELVMISHTYGMGNLDYAFVAFFHVPDGGIQVG